MHGVLKNGEAFYPYWGKSFTTITGLDPLGLQTASEKIYSYLLPGLTNLTNRIRYYGFYCWLLKKYIELYDDNITQQSQRKFIRRSELLIALIMIKHDTDVGQITGSQKAREILSEIGGNGSIDIGRYADDRTSEEAYWKYATGAFGQYYAASVRQIGLIKETMVSNDHHVYMITEEGDFVTGLELAEAFDSVLDEDHKNLFLASVQQGSVTTEQCLELHQSFSISDLPLKSLEAEYYLTLLNGADYPKSKKVSTANRSATISSLTSHIEESEKGSNPEEYLAFVFQQNWEEIEEIADIEYFWYLYRVNEYWQYSLGAIFWAAMKNLNNYGGAYAKDDLIKEVVDTIVDSADINPESNLRELTKKPDINTLKKLSEEIESAEKAGSTGEVLSSSIRVLLYMLGLSPEKVEADFNVLVEHKLVHKPSYWTDYLKMREESDFEKPIRTFLIDFISTYILNRHKKVALRKLGNGSRSSIKFNEERGVYFYKGNFSPSFTNPRIGTVLNMLSDLGKVKLDEKEGVYKAEI